MLDDRHFDHFLSINKLTNLDSKSCQRSVKSWTTRLYQGFHKNYNIWVRIMALKSGSVKCHVVNWTSFFGGSVEGKSDEKKKLFIRKNWETVRSEKRLKKVFSLQFHAAGKRSGMTFSKIRAFLWQFPMRQITNQKGFLVVFIVLA